MALVPENGNKKWFPLVKKSVSTSRNKVIFQKIQFSLRFPLAGKKSLNQRILFQQKKNWFPLAVMENSFKNTFLLCGKTAYIERNI